jgi:hypothetical protein
MDAKALKKMFPYNVLGNRTCIELGCYKRIKKRLLKQKKPRNITRCYKHGEIHKIRLQGNSGTHHVGM